MIAIIALFLFGVGALITSDKCHDWLQRHPRYRTLDKVILLAGVVCLVGSAAALGIWLYHYQDTEERYEAAYVRLCEKAGGVVIDVTKPQLDDRGCVQQPKPIHLSESEVRDLAESGL